MPPGDADALAGKLEALLALPASERRAIGARGREKVVERYAWERIGSQLEALYRKVMEAEAQGSEEAAEHGGADVIATVPRYRNAPQEYRYALDAAMSLLSGAGRVAVECPAPELRDEVYNRIPQGAADGPADAALWVEPDEGDWQAELAALAARLSGGGRLVIVASLPLAKRIPERAGWQAGALGLQRGGLGRLRQGLAQAGFAIEGEYGVHTLASILAHRAGELLARGGRPDAGDRRRFAGNLRYCATGPGAMMATVALIVARRGSGWGSG